MPTTTTSVQYRLSRAEYEHAAGVFGHRARIELVDGELHAMTPEGTRHPTAIDIAVGRIRFDAVVLLFLWLCTLTLGRAWAQEPNWTNDPLVPGVTPIRAVHFTELRTRINELSTGCGGAAFAFTDAGLMAGETPVRAVHVIELRAALDRAYDARGGSRPTWSDPAPARGSAIRARHLTELRAATGALSARSPLLESYYAYIPLNVVDPSYPPQPFFSASADLDGDGNEDLIILGADYPDGQSSSYSAQPGRVLLGDGDGGFTVAPSELYPVDTLNTVHPRNVPFGDLNGDGRLDMFVADHGWDTDPWPGEQNRSYLSRPGGGWRDATDELPQLSDYSHSAAVGDIRGRGVIDIIVGNGYGGQNGILPYALLNDGDGSFVAHAGTAPESRQHRLRPHPATHSTTSRIMGAKGKRSTRRGRENQPTVGYLRAHWNDFGPDPRISIAAPLRCRGQRRRHRKGLHSRRRPHTTVAGRDSHPLRNGAFHGAPFHIV